MNRPSRRTLIVAAALALVASLVAVGRLATLGGPTASSGRPGAAPSVVRLGVSGPVDDVARTLESVAGNRIIERVWILRDGLIWRVDPDSGRAAAVSGDRPRADRPLVRLTATRAGGLVATVAGGGLLVLDPQTARVVATEPVDTRARVASTVDSDVFAVCCGGPTPPGGGRLLRLLGPRPRRMVALPGRPDAVGLGPSGVWVRGVGGGVWHIDIDSLRVLATVAIPGGLGVTPGSVAVTTGAVWVSDPAGGPCGASTPSATRSSAACRPTVGTWPSAATGRSGRPAGTGCSAWTVGRCVVGSPSGSSAATGSTRSLPAPTPCGSRRRPGCSASPWRHCPDGPRSSGANRGSASLRVPDVGRALGMARSATTGPGRAHAVATAASGVWAVCCEAGARRGQLTRVDPASGRVVKVIRLPGHPYALGIGPSGVWVRDAMGCSGGSTPPATASSPPSGCRPARSTRASQAVTSPSPRRRCGSGDPAATTVWRIDPQRNHVTDDRWEADGSDLTVAADGVVWATSDVKLLGLGGPDVRGPAVGCTSWTPIGSLPQQPLATVGCGWARRRGCSTSTSASCARG